MRKINLRTLKIPIILFLVLLISLAIIPLSLKHNDVKAETITELTDSDTFPFNNIDYNITDYDNLIGTQYIINYDGDGFEDNYYYDDPNDDPIVKIIPKQLFLYEGDYLKVGQEYGYFISTIESGSYYFSTVLVFDIENIFNDPNYTDNVITTVKPIFEYNYVCLKPYISSFINISGCGIHFNVDNYCIVPIPVNLNYPLNYNFAPRYYLKDISFGASLFNEQELNKGEEGYCPQEDYGSYFTGYDYSYHGKYREYGEFPIEQLALNMEDTFWYALGFIDAIPFLGTATSLIGQAYDTISLANGWIQFGQDVYSNCAGTVESIEKEITATCYYQNRDDQLAYYRDYNNEPYLIRTAALACNTGIDKSIWYGINDDVTGYFKVNHSALNGLTPYYTRFTNDIALKVVSAIDDEVKAVEHGITSLMLRDPVYKPLSIDKEETVHMFQQSKNYFKFTADFSSKYNIKVNSEITVKMTVNDEIITGSNNNFIIDLQAGETANIKIYENEQPILSNIVISPSTSLSEINIKAGEEYIIKTEISGLKNLKTNDINIRIKGIYTSIVPTLVDAFETIVAHDEITCNFLDDCYYIILKNDAGLDKSNVNLNITENQLQLALGENQKQILPNLTYLKFSTDSEGDGQYVFSISEMSLDYLIIQPFTSNFDSLEVRSYKSGEYIITLAANTTYYIGITNGLLEDNAEIEISKLEDVCCWYITGGEYGEEGQKIFERSVSPTRGHTYTLIFLINDIDYDLTVFYQNANDLLKADIKISSDRTLTITDDAPIDGRGVILRARDFDKLASFDITLEIIPKSIITIDPYNENDVLGFNYEVLPGTTRFKYTLECGGSISEPYEVQVSDGSGTVSILDNYNDLNCSTIGYITIKIKEIYFIIADNEIVYNESLSINVHNTFAGGSGTSTDPYNISCYRHLNNIRNAIDSTTGYAKGNFKLLNDISLSGNTTWTPIDNFSGVLDGANFTINPTSSYSFIICVSYNEFTYYGLIRNLRPGGEIKNLKINNLSISGDVKNSGSKVYVGGIAGYNNGTISNCRVLSGRYFVAGRCGYVGGIVGYNSSGSITNCNNYANISGHGTLGGIFAKNYGTVVNCINYGTIILIPYY